MILMSDIRKRVGSKGTTYQVRYPSTKTKSGYAYATFDTMKEARAFRDNLSSRTDWSRRSVSPHRASGDYQSGWKSVRKRAGTGAIPVTLYTIKTYEYRADMMKAYDWTKALSELQSPDIVAFRSWLLDATTAATRRARCFHLFNSVMKEMALRGHVVSNVAAGVSIRADSRYDRPVEIPT